MPSYRVMLLFGSIVTACCLAVAGNGERWTAGIETLPEMPARIRVATPIPGTSAWEAAEESPHRIVDGMVARGWSADDIRFAPLDRLLPPVPRRRSHRVGRAPVPWPGMHVDPDYAFLAESGRRRIPWGTAALAAAGLMFLATRKW